MRVPLAELIDANVLDTLRGISTAAGYCFDVARAEWMRGDWTAEHRKILVNTPDYTIIDRADHTETRRQLYQVVIHWLGEDEPDPSPEVRLKRMAEDVIRAMMDDYTRGGLAQSTMNAGAELYDNAIIQNIEVIYNVNPADPRAEEQTPSE